MCVCVCVCVCVLEFVGDNGSHLSRIFASLFSYFKRIPV